MSVYLSRSGGLDRLDWRHGGSPEGRKVGCKSELRKEGFLLSGELCSEVGIDPAGSIQSSQCVMEWNQREQMKG